MAQQRHEHEHTTTVTEQGRFCLARCTCGWRGPARRARSKARSDAADHVEGNPPLPDLVS
ncbi:hypothetical protein ACIRF8_00070 [Streptomyces sp. NPDC102406]|uniref:hypothetical protein n=1 Tax=Streptomyces sp. NPDC102406 TaxID=3366171 RepID=UPI003826C07B